MEIASFQSDATPRKPVTIRVGRQADVLHVLSVNWRTSTWLRGLQDRHAGPIAAGGDAKEVTNVEVDAGDAINGATDSVYRSKYRRYTASVVTSVLTAQARAATPKLTPPAPGS